MACFLKGEESGPYPVASGTQATDVPGGAGAPTIPGRPESISERAERTAEPMERRTKERYAVRRRFMGNAGCGRLVPHRVVNISGCGCAAEGDVLPAEREGKVVLDVPLPSNTRSLRLPARVVWVRRLDGAGGAPPLRFGVRFEEMDSPSRMVLEAYLGFLRRDEHIARLEEAWEKLKKVQERIETMIAWEEKKKVSLLH